MKIPTIPKDDNSTDTSKGDRPRVDLNPIGKALATCGIASVIVLAIWVTGNVWCLLALFFLIFVWDD